MLPPDRLILVRHGESTWNAEERLQGQLDPPLSDRGREQSRALAGMLDGQTAELMGLEPGRFDPRWREIDVGEWGGKTAAEIDAQGSELTNWRGGPRTAPDGEPWDAFAQRVSGALDELIAAGGQWTVVCHGGCIRAAVAHVTGADKLHLGSPPNASMTVVELGARPRLLVYGSLPDGGLPTGLY
jgi:glucosyl-3-phosphoglycerate phosphatase